MPWRNLTHYTRSLDAVCGILENGFAYVPNKRNLMHLLVPGHDWSKREPQQFGMISFTEAAPKKAAVPRTKFGTYGVVVTREWAMEHDARKVHYIQTSGPEFEGWRNRFTAAFNATKASIPYPEDGFWRLAYTNRQVAFGPSEWRDLLALYEFMEPAEHAGELEWRIVHPYPLSGYGDTTEEIIANISPPRGWSKTLHVVHVTPAAVVGFIAPAAKGNELTEVLPVNLRSLRVWEF